MMSLDVQSLTVHPLWTEAADGLALVGDDGLIRATNDMFDTLFGYEPGSGVGRSVEELVPERSRSGHARLRAGFAEEPVRRAMGASRILHGQRQDGSLFPINISLFPLIVDDAPATLAAVRDITDRLAVEAQRAETERQRLIAEDHDRIARELHDSVIQHLFAVGLRLQSLPAQVSDPSVGQALNDSVDAIDVAISELRSSISGLRDTSRSSASRLKSDVIDMVGEMSEILECSTSVSFEGDVDRAVDGVVVSNLLPVLREALANVVRHAEATEVMVDLSIGDEIELAVADDGRGMPDQPDRSGLANLEARAQALGGSMRLEDNDAGGTTLRWSVPNAARP